MSSTAAPALPLCTLPVVKACDLERQEPEQRWLFRGLWAKEGVGLIGGSAKSNKTWLGLEMAVSLTSGTPCLGRFEPTERGRALLYLAEDALPDIRFRLECLCRHHGIELASLELYVITAESLRIDLEADQQRLTAAVASLRPDLLLLDPLVRLHRREESSSADMSALLGFLTQLQRQSKTAVVLVHHMRKNGAASQLGQALRGSSDLHAWGASNLYLSRMRGRLLLSIEHRAAPSPEPVELLLTSDPTPHLEIHGDRLSPTPDLSEAVLEVLRNEREPLLRETLRRRLRVKNQRLGEALRQLEASGSIVRNSQGWQLL